MVLVHLQPNIVARLVKIRVPKLQKIIFILVTSIIMTCRMGVGAAPQYGMASKPPELL